MKKIRRKAGLSVAAIALVGWLFWQFTPAEAIVAVASLSDPAKLATLGERGANSRLNKIVYWLYKARYRGVPAPVTIRLAQTLNWTREPRASLVRTSLLRNLKIAEELGLLTPENLDRLRHGKAAVVTKGPYAGSPVEIDHIVPFSLAKEVGNELANLEMLPAALNRRKSSRVGHRHLAHAQLLHQAGLLSAETLARVEARAR